MRHSKSPWRIVARGKINSIVDEEGQIIAEVEEFPDTGTRGNATLVSIAPDMMNELKTIIAGIDDLGYWRIDKGSEVSARLHRLVSQYWREGEE